MPFRIRPIFEHGLCANALKGKPELSGSSIRRGALA